MLFYSFFKSLVGKEVTVELKNDLGITGHLHSVDQYLNIKLQDIYVTCPGNGLNTPPQLYLRIPPLEHLLNLKKEKYPHLLSVKNCFIRGSVVSKLKTDTLRLLK